MSFSDKKNQWKQARYNRRAYERLMKLLKYETANTNISNSRYSKDFVQDLKVSVMNGYPPNFIPSPRRYTLLSHAVSFCCFQPAIIYALMNAGADVNLTSPNGETALLLYVKGYSLIVSGHYDRHNYIGIDKDEAGKVFSEILKKTDNVDYVSPYGETALSVLCDQFLWLHNIHNVQTQEFIMTRIYELIDAGASFENYLEGKKDIQSEGMKDLIRMVYEYQAYKDMTADVADQDLAVFVR